MRLIPWSRATRPEHLKWSDSPDVHALARHSWWLLQAAALGPLVGAAAVTGLIQGARRPELQVLRRVAQAEPTVTFLSVLSALALAYLVVSVVQWRRPLPPAASVTQGHFIGPVVGIMSLISSVLIWLLMLILEPSTSYVHAAALSLPLNWLILAWTLHRELLATANTSGSPKEDSQLPG